MRYRMKRGKILFHDLQLERMHDERSKCNVALFVSGERCLQLASTSLVSFMSLKIFQGDILSGLTGSTYWTVGVVGEMSILLGTQGHSYTVRQRPIVLSRISCPIV